jgi:4-carboxymuconolactone decarboxylase
MNSVRFEKGEKALNEVTKSDGKAVIESLKSICPELGTFIVEFAYGDVISRNGLTLKQRELSTIAMLGAMNCCVPQLKVHIQGCLNIGCTKEEIVETLLQICVYAGFPAAINAMNCAKEVFKAI